MKQLFLIIIAIAFLAACKKESSGPKDILIKKVLVNGEPESEYTYNSDGQMTEEKHYSNGPGAVVTSRSEYHYDNSGNPLERLSYKMPENKLSTRYIFTLNGQGMIARNSIWDMSGPDSGKLSLHIDHDYKEGRAVKQTWRAEDEEVTSYRTMGYYPNGNMRTSEVYWVNGGVAEKQWGSSYSPSDTTLPASFYKIKAYPVNFYYSYLTSSDIMHFTYDDGVVDQQYQEIMTDRKFNSKGLLTEVTITTKHIKPVAADEVRTLKFEYVEL